MVKHVASKQHLNCKIADMKPDVHRPGRTIISVQFDDGDKAGPWYQPFSIIAEDIVTVEDLMVKLYDQNIERPIDPLSNLKNLLETGETFVLNLTAKVEPNE